MKYMLLLFTFLLTIGYTQAQQKPAILNLLRQKKIVQLTQYCELPFRLNVGSKEDNPGITDKTSLKNSLEMLANRGFFDDFFKKGKATTTQATVSYLLTSYNRKDQTFLATSMIFHFKQPAKGKEILTGIEIAR